MNTSVYHNRGKTYETVIFCGKTILVPYPDEIPGFRFVGRRDLIRKILAVWAPINGLRPLHCRLYGPAGSGKNAIVYELARTLGKDLYIMEGEAGLEPNKVCCWAVAIEQRGSRRETVYCASKLFAAAYRGGIAYFNEIDKVPPNTLTPLASLLDDRRRLDSAHAGVYLNAHEEFLFCAGSNEDMEGGLGLPDYLDQRMRPAFHVGHLTLDEMAEVLRAQVSPASAEWVRTFVDLFKNAALSTRDAVNILKTAYLYYDSDGHHQVHEKGRRSRSRGPKDIREYLKEAYRDVVNGERKWAEEPLDQEGRGDVWQGFPTPAKDGVH